MNSSSIHRDVRFLAAFAATIIWSAAGADQAPPESAGGRLEEVVVTAQFVRQNLQETPVAITAISAADLEARGHQTVQDIAAQAPNVMLSAGGQYSGPALVGFIRGVGQLDFSPAFEPGVGLYVDDVYYSTMTGSVLDLLDLDRVEVSRGPQGTLAGKNSIGGSIKMYSQKPDANSAGYIEAGYGSYNAVTVRGASNFTLVPEKLYMRVAGVSRARDGYITRLDYVCSHRGATDAVLAPVVAQLPSWQQNPSCVLGHEGGIRYTAGRVALRWLPSDSFEMNLALDAVSDVSEPPPNVMLGAGPTIAPIMWPAIGPFGLLYDWAAPGFPFPVVPMPGCLFVAYGSNSCDPMSPNDPYVNYSPYEDPRTHMTVTDNQKVSSWGAALNLDWKFDGGLNLQSITAYRKYDGGWGNDAGATPVALQMLYQTLHHDQTSQEFRLNGTAGSMLDYTVGAFYLDETTTWDARVDLPYVGFDFLHGPDPTEATSWAAFAHGIFHVTDQFDVSAGVRYSDDEKTYTFHRHNPDGSTILACTGPLGDPTNPPNCLISTIENVSSTFSGTRTDYRLALSYQWTDAVMTYLQYSTGYKGGGINPRPFYNVQAVSFRPETLDAFELGLKSEIGNQLRLNVAVFTNKYKDVQIQHTDCSAEFPGFGIPCLAPLNSGDADVKGGEVELYWRPTGGLQVDASFSYLDFKFTSLDPNASACSSCVTPYTPKTKWALGAQYEIGLAGGATVTPRVDVSFQDRIFTDVTNSSIGAIDSYTLLNAQIAWRGADDDWTLLLEARNLTDELYYTTKTNQIDSGAGSAYGAPALPRTLMFTVQHNF